MTEGKFDPQDFFPHAEHVALHVAAAELFGFMKRSLNLPPQWAALLGRSTGDYSVVRPGGRVDGTGTDSVLFARVSPLDLVFDEEHLVTRDGYHCRARVRARVSLMPERMELRSFYTNVLGSRRVAKLEAVVRYCQPGIRAALAKIAAEHDAATLVDGGAGEAVVKAVREAVDAACFSAGMKRELPPTVQFESDALREVQEARQEATRRQAEHEARRQVQEALRRAQDEHLDHLSDLLGRVRDLAEASPEVELPELLRTFNERQRGELYEALFAAEQPDEHTRWIVVAAGEELLFFDPEQTDRPGQRLTIAGPAGPVRSIQSASTADGQVILLLGAATGVYRSPIDDAEPDTTLLVAGAPGVRGGFNAVAQAGDCVWASHSELGLYEWPLANPTAGRQRFQQITRNARAVRHVQVFDGNLYASIDERVIAWPADGAGDQPARAYTGSRATITAVCATPDGVFAGNSEGDILHWPLDRESDPERLHQGSQRAAESVWLLATHGVRRLVYTDTSLRVHARVVGDSFCCGYEAGGQTLRRVEVAPDAIVATNDLRDRLLYWIPSTPSRPRATISVASLCGHSIQDVCLVPRA